MGPPQLIEIEAARSAVLERARSLPAGRPALSSALGMVLAEDVASSEPVPGFEGSAMDGFAVRAADTRGAGPSSPATLRLIGESRAGHPTESVLGKGEAIRISTGAVVPAGADAVLRVEDSLLEGGAVLAQVEVEPGRDIRRAGEDIEAGQMVLAAGTPIGPAELGVLASLGLDAVPCHRRARVSVLVSGDELLEPGEAMRPGGVRNSNAYSISALVEREGAEVCGVKLVPDEPETTRAAIAAALTADVVVISGGVSVGEHDHVKGALAELGVEQVFWGIALKPGRPTWFGVCGETLVFGLPGNPVSVMVTFLLFVRPALAALAGADPGRRRTVARLTGNYAKQPGRAHAIRCRLELGEDGWRATPTGKQGSHILTSMLGADCLAMIPTDAASLAAGDSVQVELIGRG